MKHRLIIAPEMTFGEQGNAGDHRTVITHRVIGHPTHDLWIWQKVGTKRCQIRRGDGPWEGDFDSLEATLSFLQAELD